MSLLAVAAIWGGTFVMVKDALRDAGPLTFLAVRFVLAGLLLGPLLIGRRAALGRNLLVGGAVVGLLLVAGYVFQTAGLQFTSASKAGFITGLSVVIVPVVSAVLLRRVPAFVTLVGVALATVGLGLLTLGESLTVELGDALVLACAASFALHIVSVGRFAPQLDSLALTIVQISTAALVTIVASIAFESPTPRQVLAVFPAALFTGLFATAAAFYVQTHAQRFTSATHTALIFSTEPVFAALFAFLLAGERLDVRAILGCALILLGMFTTQLERRLDAR